MSDLLSVKAQVAGLERIDFDKKIIKAAIRSQAAAVRKVAKQLVARRAVSLPGEAPGRSTGVLMRSIKVKVSSGGFWAKVAPYKTSEMKVFYPAFLFHGTAHLAKRDNYMANALGTRREAAQAAISSALKAALKPRS